MNKSSIDALKAEISRFVIGNDKIVERILVALLADGHILLEGPPGLAKTRLMTVLAGCVGGSMQRVQFTPDLLPADILGTEVYRPQTGDFETRLGPIHCNILLVDEINRAPAKVQSALLQAMQEREVTLGMETFHLPAPFFVLATQNPIEQEGTYPLPEAQLDRFLFKVLADYPSREEERQILQLSDDVRLFKKPEPKQILDLRELSEISQIAISTTVDSRLDDYIVRIVSATRQAADFGLGSLVEWGASPRASLALRSTAKCLAFLRGDPTVLPEHIEELSCDVLRHRIVPSFEAESSGTSVDDIVRAIFKQIRIP